MPARSTEGPAPLFPAEAQAAAAPAHTPLAARLRPRTLDEFVGQEAVLGPGRLLRRAVEADQVPSLILWGPPGSGKTTLAQVIARTTHARFFGVSAVTAGVADLRKVIDEARALRRAGQRTILFIDEIHRFNKAQQDAVLQAVEQGDVVLIGATTENPSFEVNNALLSRCRVVRLEPLSEADLNRIIDRALTDAERGLAALRPVLAPEARAHLLAAAGGDARVALNALELATLAAEPDAAGQRHLTLPLIEDALQRRALRYDRAGDEHYQVISAFIKSLRGSDPDAAVYWLARMLEAGEDPLFIARRMVILAAEDVGLADPQALVVATACQQAVHFVGLPEGFLPLAECALYLALAPKSNSVLTAYGAAREDVRATLDQPVPLHLRNAVTGLDRAMGYGQGYRYAHDYAGNVVEQQYLPDQLVGRRYYTPGDNPHERALVARLEQRRQAGRRAAPSDAAASP
ncbi:MAG TPA: replication-associated recombination protein A [Chloroflexota bacterium]|nr:replication-associated recombination protein A [Chloroflexota bacterium]